MIYFLLTLGFFIRLLAINQSLWLDEAISANVAARLTYSQILSVFSPTDFHPPFYYLFLHTWTYFFGYSEFALRLPSVLFSLFTGYFVYLIVQNISTRKNALFAAAFILFNPLFVYYSQEARMYSLAVFCLTTSLYYYLQLLRDRAFASVILFNLFAALSLYSFYGSDFFLLPIFLHALFKHRRIFPYLLPSIALFLPNLVLLRSQFSHSRQALGLVPNWLQALGPVNLKNLLQIPIKFTSGRLSWEPKISYYAVSFIWAVISFLPLIFVSRHKIFWHYLLFLPLALVTLISFVSPMLSYFRLLYLLPPLAIILSLSKINQLYKYLLVTGFLSFSLIYLLFPQFHREDWKSLTSDIPQNSSVYMINSFSDPLIYYRPDLTLNDISSPITEEDIFVIPYGSAIHGIDHSSLMTTQGYHLNSTANFRGLVLEKWVKTPTLSSL